jgi:hypothetical protein
VAFAQELGAELGMTVGIVPAMVATTVAKKMKTVVGKRTTLARKLQRTGKPL